MENPLSLLSELPQAPRFLLSTYGTNRQRPIPIQLRSRPPSKHNQFPFIPSSSRHIEQPFLTSLIQHQKNPSTQIQFPDSTSTPFPAVDRIRQENTGRFRWPRLCPNRIALSGSAARGCPGLGPNSLRTNVTQRTFQKSYESGPGRVDFAADSLPDEIMI